MKEVSFGASGYRLVKHKHDNTIQFWSPAYSVALLMSKEEYDQFIRDCKEVFESGHSD